MENQNNQVQKLVLSSKKKWFWLAIAIALLNPIFSGLILGIGFLSEPALKREGKWVLGLAIVWGLTAMFIAQWLKEKGYIGPMG